MRNEHGPARPLTADEIRRLLRAGSHRDRTLVWVMLGGGLRVSEACALRVSDIGSDGSVLIRASTSKNGRSQRCYLSAQAMLALTEWIGTLEYRTTGSPVFPSRKGGNCMTADTGVALIKTLMLRAGIVGASSHSLRRTTAQALRDQGATLEVVCAQLRHSSISVTQRYLAAVPQGWADSVGRMVV